MREKAKIDNLRLQGVQIEKNETIYSTTIKLF